MKTSNDTPEDSRVVVIRCLQFACDQIRVMSKQNMLMSDALLTAALVLKIVKQEMISKGIAEHCIDGMLNALPDINILIKNFEAEQNQTFS